MADQIKTTEIPDILPLIPLRDLTIFPNLVVPLFVGREKSIKALEDAMKENHIVALATQKDSENQDPMADDLYLIGSAATVMQELKLGDGTARALVEGVTRIRIVEFVQTEPYFKVRVEKLEEAPVSDPEVEALMRTIVSQFEKTTELGKPIPQEVIMAAFNINQPGRLADFVTFHLNLKTDERQSVLEAIDPRERLLKINEFLLRELEILEIGSKIQSRVREQMTKTQREYFLREQLKAIQKELGNYDEQSAEIDELMEKIKAAEMPEEVAEKALKELDRLAKMPQGSAETSVIRTYLDWLIKVPWNITTKDKLELKAAEKILNDDHYGLEPVKKRVLEFLAVHQLSKKQKGPILCFAGPPGTGKTSIGRSIARALDRKFIRVSLGGVRDEAEIRGHRRTYVGALPGRIIQSVCTANTRNPVFMMDEIDKLGVDFRGDPSSALLEVLDPEQNNAFSDHYLEVPLDMSDVMFICTANILDTIPPALRDRMEVIEFPGYIETEKLMIAKRFLIKKQLEAHGLKKKFLTFDDAAITKIIQEHTREAGVRNLERKIAGICRQVARKIVEGSAKSEKVTSKNLQEYLGPAEYRFGLAEERDEVGVATGLAWTQAGGDIMSIEATVLTGKGKLILTGHLGEVMQESAQAALSYIRSRSEELGIDPNFLNTTDIHIHVPGGAIPKDGPSAGITMAIAMASALTKKTVNREVGMTGEITLRGRILPIGGLKEKVLAAKRSGLKHILVPYENQRDLEMVSKQVKQGLKFTLVAHMDDVMKIAFSNFSRKKKPSAVKAAAKSTVKHVNRAAIAARPATTSKRSSAAKRSPASKRKLVKS